MPNYGRKCTSCGHEFKEFAKMAERNDIRCEECNEATESWQIGIPPRIVSFPSGMWEHITTKPIYIGSKKDLKRACKDHDVSSAYLDDY